MREKSYTAYEEMIHIPLIVHNRRLYPEPRETTAFYDHRSLLPTILDLAGVPDVESYGIAKSIVPVMQDPSKSVQDHTLFSYDDVFFVPATSYSGDTRRRLDLRGLFRHGRFRMGIRERGEIRSHQAVNAGAAAARI
jgi:arylsulfatase A-like enzyme